MKNIIYLMLFVLPLTISSQEIFNNQSVIDMRELGFEEKVIIDKIESTNSDFDTSIGALKTLKESGVSPAILSAMIKATKKETIDTPKEKTTVIPTADSESFVWKAGNGEYVDVEFEYFVEDETIEQEVLKQVVMNVMVQAKFKLKNRNTYMPKRLTIMKGSTGLSAICKYTGKNAYGAELESSSYFSFVNQGDGSVSHMFTN